MKVIVKSRADQHAALVESRADQHAALVRLKNFAKTV